MLVFLFDRRRLLRNFCCAFLHSEHSRAAEQQQQLKSSDVESDMHFIRRVHTEASRSRATSFECNKNKIHVFFASSSFFRCCFEYIPSNFNLQWSRLLFYFFSQSHFVLFCFWFCRAFLHLCRRRRYLLACCFNFIMPFFWDLFINWLHSDCFLWTMQLIVISRMKATTSSGGVIGSIWNRNLLDVHFHMTLWCDPLSLCVLCVNVHIKIQYTLKRSDVTFDRDVTTFTFNIAKAGKQRKCTQVNS